MLRSTAITLALCLATVAAQAAVVDFDTAATGTFLVAPYDEDGFRIVVQTEHYDIWGPPIPSCGNPAINPCTSNYLNVDDHGGFGPSHVRLVKADGANFDLLSMNILASSTRNLPGGGSLACGTACTLISASGGLVSLQSHGVMQFAGAEWMNLAWIEFVIATPLNIWGNSTYAAIDDINVVPSAIPTPAAVWLFGSALGVMGWLRRQPAAAS